MLKPIRVAIALALTAPAALHAQAADPAASLTRYNDAVVAVMKAKLPTPARIERFEALLRTHYDMPAITALVAGAKWGMATAAERDAATAALTRHSASSLARNFATFGGQQFVVDPAVVTRGSSRIVKSTIVSGARRDVLLYRLTQSGGGWRIVDVIAQGVSQLAVQRAELASATAAGGLAGLTQRLQKFDAASR